MFDFLKRNKKTDGNKVGENNRLEPLYAPSNGDFVKIEEIEDPVFSQKMMGDGYGVNPSDGEVYAPIAGTIMSVFPTKHAVYIKTASDLEILVHMGLDTVELEGGPFTTHVNEGDEVAKGDLISTVDLEALDRAGKSNTIVVVVTNMDQVKDITLTINDKVNQGDEIGTIVASEQ